MFKKTNLLALFFIFSFLFQTFCNHSLHAQATPRYNVRDLIAGKIPNIQVKAVGSDIANLGLVLRFTWTGIDSFDVDIPGGTLFRLSGGSCISGADQLSMQQNGFGSFFASANRIGGGGRPTIEQSDRVSSSMDDVLIYAVCTQVNELAPMKDFVYLLSVDSLELIPRFAKLISAFENLNMRATVIDNKIKAGQLLSDEETRCAAFIDWIEDPGQTSHISILKQGLQQKTIIKNIFSYSEIISAGHPLQEYMPEIWRFPAQNVVWTMMPEDIEFSSKAIRNDISNALHINNPDSLDNMMRQANDFLDLLGMDRKLLVEDSLIFPIDHNIWYPPFYSTTWNGAGGGFAARMSVPYSWKKWNKKWQILKISYFLLTNTPGNFKAAIMKNNNGKPGVDLMGRKTVSFGTLSEKDFVTIDVSSEQIIIEDDFFIALFQNAASNPRIILSLANNARAYGFNSVNWEADAANYFFGATVKLINSVPYSPKLISPADNEQMPISTAKFIWSKATDPDAGNKLTYDLQLSSVYDFASLLHFEKDIPDTVFSFLSLPQEIRDQMKDAVYWRVRTKDNWNATSQFSDYKSFVLKNDFITEIVVMDPDLPKDFALHSNYPNPFNPTTAIQFDMPRASFVTITIFNIMGQKIKTLVNQQINAGRRIVTWDGQNENGLPIGNGVYFICMKTSYFEQIRKMTLLR